MMAGVTAARTRLPRCDRPLERAPWVPLAPARGPVREWAVPTPSRHELLLARDSWAVEVTHLGVGQSTPRSRPRAARHEQVLDDAVTAPGHVLGARPSRLRGRRDRSSSATNSHESQSRVRPRSAPPWSGSVPQATASTLLERAKAYGRTPAGAQTQLRSRVRSVASTATREHLHACRRLQAGLALLEPPGRRSRDRPHPRAVRGR